MVYSLVQAKIELLTDPDMVRMFQNSVRGGLCFLTTQKIEANHPYLHTFDPDKPISEIHALDANNL